MDSNHSFLTVSQRDRYQALKVCTPIGSSFQSLSSRTHADRPPPTLHCIGWQIAHTDGKCFLPCKLPSTTNRSRHSVRSNESDDPSEDWGIILTSCRLEVDYTLLFSPCRLFLSFFFFPPYLCYRYRFTPRLCLRHFCRLPFPSDAPDLVYSKPNPGGGNGRRKIKLLEDMNLVNADQPRAPKYLGHLHIVTNSLPR